ncbi:MAG: transcription elongation factor GreA [Gammaproteobacteria bacterium]|nr:transcription elongation factor GreA [Gammaproteobacteria bacterium]MCI0591359.1 transcription elongation factor GreA [Gammaproteobacteria bacterium]
MGKSPMTTKGAQKLREELHRLKTEVRPGITKAIAHARSLGDLSENAEYLAAREQQSFVEGRIALIESKLNNAQIIDLSTIDAKGKVVFGSTVHLVHVETLEEVVYQIVGEDEADINNGLVSIISPVARAMIGKEQGVVVEVITPSGVVEYEIRAISYK